VVDHIDRGLDAAPGIETLDNEVRADDQLRAFVLGGNPAAFKKRQS
jgi:hypothetical protein